MFFGWKSLLFGSLTAPKSHLYPEVHLEISGLIFRFRYAGHVRFKKPRESWYTGDLGLLVTVEQGARNCPKNKYVRDGDIDTEKTNSLFSF